ncbi:MAG: hypothetical protein KDB80_09685 [Planctomycetes bacterium]|nr:hypothetical protein [Planctomycetota bacterium]
MTRTRDGHVPIWGSRDLQLLRDIWLADFDGDRDADYFIWEASGGRALLNRAWQLESAYSPRPGWRYTLAVHGIQPISQALVLLAPGRLTTPLETPFGRLHLNPFTAIPWFIPPTAELLTIREVSVDIPNDPIVVGVELHAQAAVPSMLGMPPRLTNLVSDVVAP